MLCSRPVCVPVSIFDKSRNAPAAKFLDGSFNNNHTNFGSKSMDAVNLLTYKPVQPSAKLLNNWFNGNTTIICPKPKSMSASTTMLMRPM
jgi:hypothetical protein